MRKTEIQGTPYKTEFDYSDQGMRRTYTVKRWRGQVSEVLGRFGSFEQAWEAAEDGETVFSEMTQTHTTKAGSNLPQKEEGV